MAYQDKYESYLAQIPADIEVCKETGRSHVFGYTSNYDVVFKWDIDVYNQIFDEFLKEEPMARASGPTLILPAWKCASTSRIIFSQSRLSAAPVPRGWRRWERWDFPWRPS